MIRFAEELDKLVYEAGKENVKRNNVLLRTKAKRVAISAAIQFSSDEIEQMGDLFKELFLAGGGVAHILKYQKGKRKPVYEIRYRRHGVNITVVDKDLRTAKELFIKETNRGDLWRRK